MDAGQVGILNVGAGDTKLTFDRKNPKERERAAAIVTDMLRRGYALLVQVGTKHGQPLYQRAKAFDPKKCEYIIASAEDESSRCSDRWVSRTVPAKPARSRLRRRPEPCPRCSGYGGKIRATRRDGIRTCASQGRRDPCDLSRCRLQRQASDGDDTDRHGEHS